MEIGTVIRKYRKQKNMTQEEMANYLGVSAPAVNKWENGNSMPDIMLLAPIARLLGISLEELLSFREDLQDHEINAIIKEMDQMFRTHDYSYVFAWAKKKIEEFPTCYKLIIQIAVVLDANRLFREVDLPDGFEAYIESLYQRALNSQEEAVRRQTVDSLFAYYVRNKRYEEAETYLDYYSDENPEKKKRKAQLYYETGRNEEAYRLYEESLYADYQRASTSLQGIYLLAMKEQNFTKAHQIADKQTELARVFEMGSYYEVSPHLELAICEKNSEQAISIMETMLESVETLGGFQNTSMFEHMTFKPMDPSFASEIRENLKRGFREEETCDFLKGNERWEALVRKS